MQMQKLKHEIKVYQILNPQIFLLNEWGKLDRKNQESVSRLVRKLSGISNTLPLVHDAKVQNIFWSSYIFVSYIKKGSLTPQSTNSFSSGGSQADVASVYEAMTTAMVVMEGIEAMVTKLLPQVN